MRVGDLLRDGGGGGPGRWAGRCAWCHETHPADLTVVADPARLAQLVANLVDNAVRHSPPQGEVRVVARGVDDDTWWLEVCDDGPGIPADRVERVFDRFGSGGDSAGGTGLGLAIASWVCELHGGTITALPTTPGTTGAHLRAVLPRRARAGRPTHLRRGEDRDRTDHPHEPDRTGDPPPVAGVPRRPRSRRRRWRRGPAVPGAGGGALDGIWPEKGVPVQPLDRARRPGHRRLGGPDLARAQRRPRRAPSPCSRPAC